MSEIELHSLSCRGVSFFFGFDSFFPGMEKNTTSHTIRIGAKGGIKEGSRAGLGWGYRGMVHIQRYLLHMVHTYTTSI